MQVHLTPTASKEFRHLQFGKYQVLWSIYAYIPSRSHTGDLEGEGAREDRRLALVVPSFKCPYLNYLLILLLFLLYFTKRNS